MIKCNLNEILKSKKITKYALAKNTGISAHAIKKLADNQTNSISFENLTKICTKLDISVGDLLVNIKEFVDNEKKAED